MAVGGAIQLERYADDAGAAHTRERDTELPTTVAERNALTADDLIGLGLVEGPLIFARELGIEGAMPGVVRILAHTETGPTKAGISHVYLGAAAALRKDIAQ